MDAKTEAVARAIFDDLNAKAPYVNGTTLAQAAIAAMDKFDNPKPMDDKTEADLLCLSVKDFGPYQEAHFIWHRSGYPMSSIDLNLTLQHTDVSGDFRPRGLYRLKLEYIGPADAEGGKS